MKRYILSISFLIFYIPLSYSQNLVINPGLENYITCPGFGQFSNSYINNWSKPSWGSTDYYHTSCVGINPNDQLPHSGHAYFGVIAYNYGTEYREYATGELSSPLVAGTLYQVEFYVSLNDGYIQAVEEMGAYLSATAPGPYANSLHIPVTPQIQNNTGILGDTASWMLVSGTFTATGGEQYITIGNFNDDSATTIAMVGSTGSYGTYYFVDDISVTAIPDGILEQDGSSISIYPTVSHGYYNLEIKNTTEKKFRFEITDCAGKKIMEENAVVNDHHFQKQFDLSQLDNGVYFLRFFLKNQLENFKLLKFQNNH